MKNVLKVPVAIKWRLAAVMADREIDNQQLHELTGLHLGTISKLRNKKPARLDTNTLDILCKALKCEPGDLLRFVPDEDDNQKAIAKNQASKELKQDKKSIEGNAPSRRKLTRSFITVAPELPESA
jgi:putative transcriptional regulator